MGEILSTADEVIDALGGTSATSEITGQAPATVSNWRSRGRIAPEHFLVIEQALKERKRRASPDVFGMRDPAEA